MARRHRDVMRLFIADIVTGVRATGDKLPREVDLAEQFAVSRGVARETIRALEERGLVTVTHGKGAKVNDASRWNAFDPDVLGALLDSRRGTEVLAHYLECRRILEVDAAGLAAERARKKDVKRIAAAFERMEDSVARPASQAAEELFHEADIAFHQALVAATGNPVLAQLVERIHAGLLVARYPLARPQYRVERALPEHKRILAAIEAGDAEEARAAISDHLGTVAGYLRERGRSSQRRRPGRPRRPARASR
jgi:GntR family transcriptional repressor for pyruvate dehydrogenase complex